ncbi:MULTISPECIES: zinc metallopeptidase [Dictyoglomus]|jgi:Zn-dependent membrane protease YugP|uniref:Peptidase membrane zinc metallopeptidase putative n=1 Tax=Dictyoglomus turgidum (strain DSM 6724 / Z-1310) TaxID=515635 RepID=B8E0X5_DICTD|nr:MULTISPECIES: zinc metallopeptidase [Dictyoglomus]ACK42712.1 peptidase membrane zinc metallopeptidase putative [Dictyoglomus turgidum DSM 6724]HBU30771.1 peptidase [Dictyoglomus sp.]
MLFWWDPTYILLLPALILSIYASMKVRSTFAYYSEIPNSRRLTGREAAEIILRSIGLDNVRIEPIPGTLTDHYDPTTKVLRLSEPVYSEPSVAALGVAAHEIGHAIQHATGYYALALRSSLVPVANIGTNLAFPLFFLGFIFGSSSLMNIGILAFSLAVLFYLITLPVEINASKRAQEVLLSLGLVTQREAEGVKKVLNAAALTYLAAALTALLNLLRLILLANMRRRD